MPMRSSETEQLVLASMFLVLALLVPFLTGQIPGIGQRLLPMHIPILLCGFFCGWKYGLLVGVIAPLMRSMLFGLPLFYPNALAMSLELGTYGLVTGFLSWRMPNTFFAIACALVVAMVCGRIAFGTAMYAFFQIDGNVFTWSAFLGMTVIDAIPGIVLQLVVIPPIVYEMHTYQGRFADGS
jgi:thiamine transporter ThiT